MMRTRAWSLAGALLLAVAVSTTAADWYTRVKLQGVREAAAEDVALFEKGRLPESLHIGDCYYHLERWREGVAVFRRLRASPDRNYAAFALAREAEGLVRIDRRAEAKALFERCLAEFPDAFLDVDVPQLCRAWIAEIGEVAPAPPEAGDAGGEAARKKSGEGSLRDEIGRLESEITALRERLEALKRSLREGD